MTRVCEESHSIRDAKQPESESTTNHSRRETLHGIHPSSWNNNRRDGRNDEMISTPARKIFSRKYALDKFDISTETGLAETMFSTAIHRMLSQHRYPATLWSVITLNVIHILCWLIGNVKIKWHIRRLNNKYAAETFALIETKGYLSSYRSMCEQPTVRYLLLIHIFPSRYEKLFRNSWAGSSNKNDATIKRASSFNNASLLNHALDLNLKPMLFCNNNREHDCWSADDCWSAK